MVKLEKESVKISVVKVFGLAFCELGSLYTVFWLLHAHELNCGTKCFWAKFEIKIKIKIVKQHFQT
jgi:hypothetical protein